MVVMIYEHSRDPGSVLMFHWFKTVGGRFTDAMGHLESRFRLQTEFIVPSTAANPNNVCCVIGFCPQYFSLCFSQIQLWDQRHKSQTEPLGV